MIHKFKIFNGALTNYQLSEALEIPVEEVQDIFNGNVHDKDLCPEVIKRIHLLEDSLFGM